MSVFFPSVSIVIHGSNKCPHSHPRLSPSPSIIQSFILSMASIMGKPLVRTAWLRLGCCCCNEGIFAFKWLLMRWWWYDPPTLPHENWTYELGQLGRLMIKIHRREKQIVVCLLLWLLTCCCCCCCHSACSLPSIFLLLSCCCWYCLHYVYVCHHCVHRIDNL